MSCFECRHRVIPGGLVMLCAAVCAPASAQDLGVVGPTYTVIEQNAIDQLLRKASEMERTGKLAKMQQAATARALNSAKNPKGPLGLAMVTERTERLLDPTITYAQAVTTDDGRVVVPAGAKINPLVMTALSKRLVFFDGRNAAQTEAVRRMVLREGVKVKPILIAGSWYDTTKAWKTQVYFDQQGRLSSRFGVKAVPTVISQQGALLLLQEIPAGELQ